MTTRWVIPIHRTQAAVTDGKRWHVSEEPDMIQRSAGDLLNGLNDRQAEAVQYRPCC